MLEKDPIEDKFRSAFADREQEPPARVWENLDKALHAGPGPAGFWTRIADYFLFHGLHPVFYITLGSVAIGLVAITVYLGPMRHYVIRGHAFAGEKRLCRGTAELFKVSDKTLPWDSVGHYSSAIIDNYGHFQFSRVRNGKYLLRTSPEKNSDAASCYLSTWFDRHERSDSADLIIVERGDINADARLIPK